MSIKAKIHQLTKAARAAPTHYTGEIVAPRSHTNVSQREVYRSNWSSVRPGADEALAVPSRMNNRLHYRDGRVEVIA